MGLGAREGRKGGWESGEWIAPYKVWGSAPPGERCTICGKAGDVRRIKHGGEVNMWHQDCAREHFEKLANPPVKLPELPPDPFDEHGAPHPAGDSEPGLSQREISEHAAWYVEKADRLGLGLDQAALDRDLRRRLTERGVLREFVAVEFERVMEAVFPTRRGPSVPFMMTQEMRHRLRLYGYSEDAIHHLTPQQAHEIPTQNP